MGDGRIPGPMCQATIPVCQAPRPIVVEDGTMCRAPSPTPGSVGIATTQSSVGSWDITHKLLAAARRTTRMLPAEMREQFVVLFRPDNLELLGGVLALWGVSHAIGVGEAADLVLLLWGIGAIGLQAIEAAKNIWEFVAIAVEARNEADLDRAASHLSLAISMIGVATFVALILKAGARLRKLTGRVRTPGERQGTRLPGLQPNVRKVDWQNLSEWEQLELAGNGMRVPKAVREGGHTLEHHVYITDTRLQARAATTTEKVATKFTDADVAVTAINEVVSRNAGQLQNFLKGLKIGEAEYLELTATLQKEVGYGYRVLEGGAIQRIDNLHNVVVYVQADGVGGWLVRTAFPKP